MLAQSRATSARAMVTGTSEPPRSNEGSVEVSNSRACKYRKSSIEFALADAKRALGFIRLQLLTTSLCAGRPYGPNPGSGFRWPCSRLAVHGGHRMADGRRHPESGPEAVSRSSGVKSGTGWRCTRCCGSKARPADASANRWPTIAPCCGGWRGRCTVCRAAEIRCASWCGNSSYSAADSSRIRTRTRRAAAAQWSPLHGRGRGEGGGVGGRRGLRGGRAASAPVVRCRRVATAGLRAMRIVTRQPFVQVTDSEARAPTRE